MMFLYQPYSFGLVLTVVIQVGQDLKGLALWRSFKGPNPFDLISFSKHLKLDVKIFQLHSQHLVGMVCLYCKQQIIPVVTKCLKSLFFYSKRCHNQLEVCSPNPCAGGYDCKVTDGVPYCSPLPQVIKKHTEFFWYCICLEIWQLLTVMPHLLQY